MLKSSKLAKYIKENAQSKENGTYEIRNICFEVYVPYIISYLDEHVGLDWYAEVYEPISEPQIDIVVNKLKYDKNNRQAQITMADHKEIFNPTYICTTSMTYYIENDKVNVSVCMRSNDVKRFPNDVAWQKYTLDKICEKLDMQPGKIFWFVVSLYVYDKDWFYFEKLPYEIEGLFEFKVNITVEVDSYDNLKNKLKDTMVKFYAKEISIETEGDNTYVTYQINAKSLLDGRMEAYFNKDETDIILEEEYEYGIEDIMLGERNVKTPMLSNIIELFKSKNINVVDIQGIEINHYSTPKSKDC